MKKIILILVALVAIIGLIYGQAVAVPKITATKEGSEKFYTIEYSVPHIPSFSVIPIISPTGSVGDVTLEQIPNVENLTPVLWIFSKKETPESVNSDAFLDGIRGKIDFKNRKIFFQNIPSKDILGKTWSIVFFGPENNYWTYGEQWGKQYGFRISNP